jgi:hypothetical protein
MQDSRNESQNRLNETISTNSRYARLDTYQGNEIGVCIFLSASDLYELNIELDNYEMVEYQIRHLESKRVVGISGADPATVDTLTPSTTN